MQRLAVLLASLLAVSSGCGSSPTAPSSPATLRSAPTSVAVADKTLILTTSLWRDFMPISPPDGKPLAVVAQVRTSDGSPIPASIKALKLSVVMARSVWSATVVEERSRAETSPIYELVARDGPKWGPGVSVDVVVELQDGASRHLLRAADQPMKGTY